MKFKIDRRKSLDGFTELVNLLIENEYKVTLQEKEPFFMQVEIEEDTLADDF